MAFTGAFASESLYHPKEILEIDHLINYENFIALRENECKFKEANDGKYCLEVVETSYRDECDYLRLSAGDKIECTNMEEFRARIKKPFFYIKFNRVKNTESNIMGAHSISYDSGENTSHYVIYGHPNNEVIGMYPYLDAAPTQEMNLIRDKAMNTNFNKISAITSRVKELTGFTGASQCAKRMLNGESLLERALSFFNLDECSKIRNKLREKQIELKPLFEKLVEALKDFNSTYDENKEANEKAKLDYDEKYKRLCNYENLKRNLTNPKYSNEVKCLNKYAPKYIEDNLVHFKLFMSIEDKEDMRIKGSDEKVEASFEKLKKNCNYNEKHMGFLVSTPIDCRLPYIPEALDFKNLN